MRVLDTRGREKVSPGLPLGAITPFYGQSGQVPDGWALCDGLNGTPDLRDRFVTGASAVGLGDAYGASSPSAALAHTGLAVGAHSAHVVTQPSAHSVHTVTQPGNHSIHATNAAHTHDSHGTEARTAAGVNSELVTPVTHFAEGTHIHDAHSAHSGMTVDAHSLHSGMTVDAHSAHTGAAVDAHSSHGVTQPGNHSILKFYKLAWIMKVAA